MIERDFQSIFTKWLKINWRTSAAFELKLTKIDNLPFAAVKEHQLIGLWNAKNTQVVYKLSDVSFGKKPFDEFVLSGAESYIAIMFYKPNSKHQFYLIEISDFLEEKKKSERKSLTEERASEIGKLILI